MAPPAPPPLVTCATTAADVTCPTVRPREFGFAMRASKSAIDLNGLVDHVAVTICYFVGICIATHSDTDIRIKRV